MIQGWLRYRIFKLKKYLYGCNLTMTAMETIFSQILWMMLCVPEIFIVGGFFAELTQLKFPSLTNLTLRTVVFILLWSSFLCWLFLLVVISISACLCLQQQYEERNQDSTHYALAEFIWGSHFCGRSGRLTCLRKALNATYLSHFCICMTSGSGPSECFVDLLACLARCAKNAHCAS